MVKVSFGRTEKQLHFVKVCSTKLAQSPPVCAGLGSELPSTFGARSQAVPPLKTVPGQAGDTWATGPDPLKPAATLSGDAQPQGTDKSGSSQRTEKLARDKLGASRMFGTAFHAATKRSSSSVSLSKLTFPRKPPAADINPTAERPAEKQENDQAESSNPFSGWDSQIGSGKPWIDLSSDTNQDSVPSKHGSKPLSAAAVPRAPTDNVLGSSTNTGQSFGLSMGSKAGGKSPAASVRRKANTKGKALSV